jgi:hypothetical protein
MNQSRPVTGTVLELICSVCKKTFPHFRYSGDTDMLTLGLASVTSCEKNEVVLAELTADEFRLAANGEQPFEQRLQNQLNRNDLRVVRLISVQDKPTPLHGERFQDFQKRYSPATLVYSCACCAEGISRVEREATVEEFEQSGGKISALGQLEIR